MSSLAQSVDLVVLRCKRLLYVMDIGLFYNSVRCGDVESASSESALREVEGPGTRSFNVHHTRNVEGANCAKRILAHHARVVSLGNGRSYNFLSAVRTHRICRPGCCRPGHVLTPTPPRRVSRQTRTSRHQIKILVKRSLPRNSV